MDTWYKVSKYSIKIEPVEVVRATAKSVTVQHWSFDGKSYERRYVLVSAYDRFFQEWKEAHAWALERAIRQLENANSALVEAKTDLLLLKQMKPPKTKPD